MTTYEIHPYASCWAKPDNFDEIKSSIQTMGQLEPITLFEDQVLDGAQRYAICQELGIEPRFHTPEIKDPLQYVLAKNRDRRHATLSQVSMAVVKMANLSKNGSNQFGLKRGSDLKSDPSTVTELSHNSGISKKELERSKRTRAQGIPELVAAVEQGLMSATQSNNIASLPKDEQPAALATAIEKKSAPKKPKAKRKPKPGAPKIVARQPKWVPLTPEESGFPVNGTMREQDAHMARYGRVQIHPKVIHDIREHNATLTWISSVIDRVASDDLPPAEACCEAVVALKAWVPQPERGEEYAINYANKARTHIANINERLPIAIERLTKLYDLWQARKT